MADHRFYEEVPKVIESKGECKTYGCNTFGLLGNGYCVTCWDRRDRDSLREKRKGKKDE